MSLTRHQIPFRYWVSNIRFPSGTGCPILDSLQVQSVQILDSIQVHGVPILDSLQVHSVQILDFIQVHIVQILDFLQVHSVQILDSLEGSKFGSCLRASLSRERLIMREIINFFIKFHELKNIKIIFLLHLVLHW